MHKHNHRQTKWFDVDLMLISAIFGCVQNESQVGPLLKLRTTLCSYEDGMGDFRAYDL